MWKLKLRFASIGSFTLVRVHQQEELTAALMFIESIWSCYRVQGHGILYTIPIQIVAWFRNSVNHCWSLHGVKSDCNFRFRNISKSASTTLAVVSGEFTLIGEINIYDILGQEVFASAILKKTHWCFWISYRCVLDYCYFERRNQLKQIIMH